MQEINLEPLFEYLGDFKAEIKAEVANLAVRVGGVENSVDNLTKEVKDFREEFIVMNYRVGKLESKIS